MPLYQFKCNLCNKEEEKYIYMQDKDFKKEMHKHSPRCDCSGKKVKMNQQLTSPDVIIKKLTLGDLMDDPSRKRPMEFFDTKKRVEKEKQAREEKFGKQSKNKKQKVRRYYVD